MPPAMIRKGKLYVGGSTLNLTGFQQDAYPEWMKRMRVGTSTFTAGRVGRQFLFARSVRLPPWLSLPVKHLSAFLLKLFPVRRGLERF